MPETLYRPHSSRTPPRSTSRRIGELSAALDTGAGRPSKNLPTLGKNFKAEALAAAGLSKSERAVAIKRRKQIWEALHPISGTNCPTIPERGRGRPEEFAADTASVSGQTKRDINRHLARAEALAAAGLSKSEAPEQPVDADQHEQVAEPPA